MSTADLAQFIRYHKSTHERYTVRVLVDDVPVDGAYVHDDVATNRLSVVLPNAPSIVLDVMGPVSSRLQKIKFDGYRADVFLHA